MSVSLREGLARVLNNYNVIIQGDGVTSLLDDLESLFPTQLTEKEVKEILKNVHRPRLPLKEETWNELASALIGKCATPTFSGGEKDEMEQRKEIAKLLFKRKDMIPNNSMWLAAEIQDLFIPKPIPAEKKECEHDWELKSGLGVMGLGELFMCKKCGENHYKQKPEPKPKDRIEELDNQKFIDKIKDIKEPEDLMGLIGDMLGEYKDKINELTRHINKES